MGNLAGFFFEIAKFKLDGLKKLPWSRLVDSSMSLSSSERFHSLLLLSVKSSRSIGVGQESTHSTATVDYYTHVNHN